jgi:hypothetical protein
VTRKALNSLHTLSKEHVIRRELLLHEGDAYVQVLMDEVARNMRARMPFEVSLVVLVPVVSSEPGKVDVLVITKDVWSLRLGFDIAATAGGLEKLVIVPEETNVAGLHHTLLTRFEMWPASLTFGLGYAIPRFGDSWIGASATGSVSYNRQQGQLEGSAVDISVGQPLYSTRTDWAWSSEAKYAVGVVRRYSNAEVFLFDSRTTPDRDRIPFEYKSRSALGTVGVTRSFGWALKNDFGLSFNAASASYDTFDLSKYNPIAAADFRARALPIGETRVYPMASFHSYKADYLRTLDIATLALQEDYQLGHDVLVSVYPVLSDLGSTRGLVGVSARAGYTVPMGDGLVRGSVTSVNEDASGTITDGSVGGSLGVVTPRIFGWGRFVMNASFLNRYKNYLNAQSYVGGSDRLRGYPTAFFFGKDTIFYNLEYRSSSFEFLKTQIGGVAFFDAGDAAQGFDMLRAKQSVGAGIRILFPQVNRNVLRFDVAVPLRRGPFPETGSALPVDPVGFYFSFDQAFGLPAATSQ